MRTLLLFRGSPGCGKTTFIEQHGLKQYALSADDIRALFQSPQLQPDGSIQFVASASSEREVWNIVFRLLEARMNAGEFTVIDATNTKTSEMNRYKDLAKKYKYRMYLVDMTDLPIEECKRRNASRPSYKVVPESVIEKAYARFATQKVPSGITIIKPEEIYKICYWPINFDKWDKIHIIGDIHGCYTCLQEYLGGDLKDNEFYIFCGDYIDRGIENAEMVKFLLEIAGKENVLLIEGNHERWLNYYAHDERAKSEEFENKTRRQLDNAQISKKDIRILYKRFIQCAWFIYDKKSWFVSHGGVSRLRVNPLFISTDQMIKGVGGYGEVSKVIETWGNMYPNSYQVFGHRNVESLPINAGHNCFLLEDHVERGGNLRAIEIAHGEPVKCVETKNNVFLTTDEMVDQSTANNDSGDCLTEEQKIANLIENFRSSEFIREKSCLPQIHSFNFTRGAFYDQVWNELVCKARGLFIDVLKDKVFARSYNKFFNINERPETKIEALQTSFKFPVKAYIKENGYLGILSYDYYTDTLFFASKSECASPNAMRFKEIFNEIIPENARGKIKEFLKHNSWSLVFEVIDPVNDPHIIEYDSKNIVLLDCIKNSLEFEKVSYDNLVALATQFNLPVKKQYKVFNDWHEFFAWYTYVNQNDINGKNIEGFVIEDSAGVMVKLKLPYYREWKFLRSVAMSVNKYGAYPKTSALITPIENYFYGFLRKMKQENPDHLKDMCAKANIIQLRKEFYAEAIEAKTTGGIQHD